MASDEAKAGVVLPKLGLVGATVNAMALIAPGAFLWITYQLQAAATAPSGASVANDVWPGIVLALIVAFLTALSYAQLAKIYPEAGFASCAYFAEKAWLDARGREEKRPEIGGPRIETCHRLGCASLLLGLFRGHGRDDGDPDRLHLQPIHRPVAITGQPDHHRCGFCHCDRLHSVPRSNRVNDDGYRDKHNTTCFSRCFQRPCHLVPHRQPPACQRSGPFPEASTSSSPTC